MSSIDSEWTRKLKEVEDERDLWKERYLDLNLKHEQLLTKFEKQDFQLSQESTSDEENQSKRPNIDQDENFQDPLKLPEPCVRNILQHFSGKELLKLMEVSKHWKNYIESSNFLMDLAMDKVVACFDNDKSLFVYEGSTRPLNRRYKHARAVFPQVSVKRQDAMDHAIFGRYGNSFESLTLTMLDLEEDLHISIKPVSFNKLKKLQINLDYDEEGEYLNYYNLAYNLAFETFIKNSSFPEVTKLYFPAKVIRSEFVKEFLCKFPNLSVLFISWEPEDIDVNEDLTITRFEQQPKLKCIGLSFFNQEFLQTFSETLLSVYIHHGIDKEEINILLNLPKLVYLKMSLDCDGEEEDDVLYTQNNKLSTLVVREGGIEDIHKLLLAVRNLKFLILETMAVTEVTINFIASNMVNLKSLICCRFSVKARNAHSNLQKNEENRFANTAFSVEVKQRNTLIHNLEDIFEAL